MASIFLDSFRTGKRSEAPAEVEVPWGRRIVKELVIVRAKKRSAIPVVRKFEKVLIVSPHANGYKIGENQCGHRQST